MGSVVGKPRAQTGDVPSCRSTLFWHRSRAQSQRFGERTVSWLQHAVPHMWFLVCCAARLVCRLAVLCVCAHTCSLRWWALRAGCLLICSLLGTLSLAALRTGKWLGLASAQVWEQRRSVSRLGRAAVGQRSGKLHAAKTSQIRAPKRHSCGPAFGSIWRPQNWGRLN